MRYWAYLENINGAYSVRLQGPEGPAGATCAAELGPAATLEIKGEAVALGDLVARLTTSTAAELKDWLDERGQTVVGSYLFGQLFGPGRFVGGL